MAEKKRRKKRSDIGKKRKPRIKNPYLQTGSINMRHIGTNLTQLVGLMSRPHMPNAPNYQEGEQGLVTIQKELTELSKAFKADVEERFKAQQSKKLTQGEIGEEKPDEEERTVGSSQQELEAAFKLKEFALTSNIKNRRKEIEQLKQQKEEEIRLSQEAVARADEAELELRQMTTINDEMFQEVERKKQESEALTTQMKRQKNQSIFDKANAMSLATLKTIVGDIEGDITDYRASYLGSQGITEFNITKKRKQFIFEPKEGIYEGEEFIPNDIIQLEQERGQMENQLGGLHDTVRELMMQREDAYASNLVSESILGAIKDLKVEGYERKIQEMSQREEDTLNLIYQTTQQQLEEKEQQYQELVGRLNEEEESYIGLSRQMKKESLQAEEEKELLRQEIQIIKKNIDNEIIQGLSFKEAETNRLEENIRTLQTGNEDLKSQIKRLTDDIEFRKQMMEGTVTKKEYDESKKEIGRLNKELKYAREQSDKGNAMIIRQQREKIFLEQTLTTAQNTQNKEEDYEKTIATSVRQAMGAKIENMRTREERFNEEKIRLEEEFNEERQALKSKIIEANSQRDLITQTALQAEEEYNTEAEMSNNIVYMMAEDLVGQQLRNIEVLSQKQSLLQTIREATLADEEDRIRQEKELVVKLDLARQQGIEEQKMQYGYLRDIRRAGFESSQKQQKLSDISTQIVTEKKQRPQPVNRPRSLSRPRAEEDEPILPFRELRDVLTEKKQRPQPVNRPRSLSRPRVEENEEEEEPIQPFGDLRGVSSPRAEKPRPRSASRLRAEEVPIYELGGGGLEEEEPIQPFGDLRGVSSPRAEKPSSVMEEYYKEKIVKEEGMVPISGMSNEELNRKKQEHLRLGNKERVKKYEQEIEKRSLPREETPPRQQELNRQKIQQQTLELVGLLAPLNTRASAMRDPTPERQGIISKTTSNIKNMFKSKPHPIEVRGEFIPTIPTDVKIIQGQVVNDLKPNLLKQRIEEPKISLRAMGLGSVLGRDTFHRRAENKEITPELVGPKTTSLLRERMTVQKAGGQRQPLQLSKKSDLSFQISQELQNPIIDLDETPVSL